jgi:hypothetical protein
MMSCRALGRGVIDALLAWLCQRAARAGAAELRVPCLVTERNVPLRIALTGAGFRAGAGARDSDEAAGAGGAPQAVFTRRLSGKLPVLPDWAAGRAPEPPGSAEAEPGSADAEPGSSVTGEPA